MFLSVSLSLACKASRLGPFPCLSNVARAPCSLRSGEVRKTTLCHHPEAGLAAWAAVHSSGLPGLPGDRKALVAVKGKAGGGWRRWNGPWGLGKRDRLWSEVAGRVGEASGPKRGELGVLPVDMSPWECSDTTQDFPSKVPTPATLYLCDKLSSTSLFWVRRPCSHWGWQYPCYTDPGHTGTDDADLGDVKPGHTGSDLADPHLPWPPPAPCMLQCLRCAGRQACLALGTCGQRNAKAALNFRPGSWAG